jgi:hypothetical protein
LKAIITRRMRVEEERHTALESRLLAARASGFLGAHALAVVTSAAGHCDGWWLVVGGEGGFDEEADESCKSGASDGGELIVVVSSVPSKRASFIPFPMQ